eukprot:98478_1
MRKTELLWNKNNNPYYKIPSYIQNICLTYYYIPIRFDIATKYYDINNKSNNNKSVLPIQNDGTLFTTKGVCFAGHAINVGYSIGYKKDVHKYKLKINSLHQFG